MQIYFGNIKIDVSNIIQDSISKYDQGNFSAFLSNKERLTRVLISHKNELDLFCECLVNNWNSASKVHKEIYLVVYDYAELLDSFSNHLKIVHACGSCVINSNNDVLLIKRQGIWDLPKGKLEKNESLEECATREVEEETGVKSSVTSFLINTYHAYDTYGELCLKVTHWYNALYNGGVLKPQVEEDIEKIEWVSRVDLKKFRNKMYTSLLPVLEKS